MPPSTLTVNVPSLPPVVTTDQTSPVKTLQVLSKPSRKAKMIVKIRLFKGLQNGIENPAEFLEELSWAYRREYKVDEPNDPEER